MKHRKEHAGMNATLGGVFDALPTLLLADFFVLSQGAMWSVQKAV